MGQEESNARRPHTIRLPTISIWIVLLMVMVVGGALMGWYSPVGSLEAVWDWLTEPRRAGAVQALAAAGQVVFAIALVAITAKYVSLTGVIARESQGSSVAANESVYATRDSVAATNKLVQVGLNQVSSAQQQTHLMEQYVEATQELVRETVRLRKFETDPDVVVFIEQQSRYHAFIDMIVANVGHRPAYDVSFKVSPDRRLRFEPQDRSQHDVRLTSMSLFNGVQFMPAHFKYRFFFTRIEHNMPDKMLEPITISITFYNNHASESRDQFNRTVVIHPGVYRHMQHLGRPPEYDIKYSLERLQKDLFKIERNISRLVNHTADATATLHVKDKQESQDQEDGPIPLEQVRDMSTYLAQQDAERGEGPELASTDPAEPGRSRGEDRDRPDK